MKQVVINDKIYRCIELTDLSTVELLEITDRIKELDTINLIASQKRVPLPTEIYHKLLYEATQKKNKDKRSFNEVFGFNKKNKSKENEEIDGTEEKNEIDKSKEKEEIDDLSEIQKVNILLSYLIKDITLKEIESISIPEFGRIVSDVLPSVEKTQKKTEQLI